MNYIILMIRNNLNWFWGILTSVHDDVKMIYRNANRPEGIPWNMIGLTLLPGSEYEFVT